MSSPIMPVRLQEYVENGSYYPRQLLEAGGKLYIVYSDGSIVNVNKTIDLVDAVNSTETTKAATPNAVKQTYDLAAAALPKTGGTVSGNITITATPSANNHAINKGYVDTEIGKLNDAMIKEILVNNQAATITNGSVAIVIPDAPVQSVSVNGSNVAPDDVGNIAITIPPSPIQSIYVNNVAASPDSNGKVSITIPDAPVQSVSVNGTAVSPDASGNINITAVPSAIVSGLSKVATSNKYSDLDGTPTIPSASTTAPLANAASAAVGTSANYARADHVHPAPTSISGNAGSATNATNDSEGQNIAATYIKSLSVNGTTITYTRGDGTTGTITTQDTNTTYSLSSFGITASATELNYVKGVTSDIQTQLNNISSTASSASSTASAAQTTANAAMPKAGGTFTGKAYAQANTSYTTYQLRNIALSKSAATPTGNGSILGVYS